MITMVTNLFNQIRHETKDFELTCPICKNVTTIQASHHLQWRLDCLKCCEVENVRVVITEWRREEQDKVFTPFHAIKTKMYFQLPNNTNTYVWDWDFNNNKTLLQVIDKESPNPIVHVFDKLMDINLDNFVNKTKMCLVFG